MIPDSCDLKSSEAARWERVESGLRFANSYLGVSLMGWFYAIWLLMGLALCLLLVPFAITGKSEGFMHALNPVALYALVLPMAALAATTWMVKLFSRLLWCAAPEPVTAPILAWMSVLGRLSVLAALGYLWLRGASFAKELLSPVIVNCSVIAWLGLVADWTFIRVLSNELLAWNDLPAPASDREDAASEPIQQDRGSPQAKPVLRRDVGQWFKHRFPGAHKLVVWVLMPLAYVAVSSLANDGNIHNIPMALLKAGVVAPALLQILWIPGATGKVRQALVDRMQPASACSTHSAP